MESAPFSFYFNYNLFITGDKCLSDHSIGHQTDIHYHQAYKRYHKNSVFVHIDLLSTELISFF